MLNKIKKRENNNQNYFDRLLDALNKYDGQSLYLAPFNELFVQYLRFVCQLEDESLISTYRNTLTKVSPFNKHPFFPIVVTLLEGKKINAAKLALITKAINKNKSHPLYDFISLALKYDINISKHNVLLKQKLNKDDLLILCWWINTNNNVLSDKEANAILQKYMTQGHNIATFKYAALILKEKLEMKQLTDILSSMTNGNNPQFLGKLLYNLSHKQDKNIQLLLLAEAVKYDYTPAYMPLINYYEKNLSDNSDYIGLIIYYLTIASSRNIKDAVKRLLYYYENGIYVSKNITIINSLKTKLTNL